MSSRMSVSVAYVLTDDVKRKSMFYFKLSKNANAVSKVLNKLGYETSVTKKEYAAARSLELFDDEVEDIIDIYTSECGGKKTVAKNGPSKSPVKSTSSKSTVKVADILVTLKWSAPKKLSELGEEVAALHTGIYCLSRNLKSGEEVLYIGKADHQTVRDRLRDHKAKWTDLYRGVQFRYAILDSENVGADHLKEKLLTVEGALIYTLQPPQNTAGRRTYKPYYDIAIKHTGSPASSMFNIPSTVDLSMIKVEKTEIKPRKRDSGYDDWW